jgi:DNA-binding phage protein
MALTREFRQTVMARIQTEPEFAIALYQEAIELFLSGEPEAAKNILRDLVNATIGFEALSQAISTPPKSLHRMLSQAGNPTMSKLSAIFAALREAIQKQIGTPIPN